MFIEDIILFGGYRLSLILLCLSAFSFIIFLYVYLYRFYRMTAHKSPKYTNDLCPPTTVIIVVTDQIEYLRDNFETILTQDYPNDYQVVVVNDMPEMEETSNLLNDLSEKYKNRLYVTTIKRNGFKHTKRLPYTIGIKAAKYNHIIFTDPKAEVVSNKWLGKMIAGYGSNNIIVGYCGVKPGKTFRNRLFRSVNIYDSMMWLSAAVFGKPFRASMSNMGFTSELFFKIGGYRDFLRLNSGEQDIFLQRISKNNSVEVILSKSASVFQDMTDYSTVRWFHERVFKAYTTKFYSASKSFYLTLVPLFSFLFWAASAVTLIVNIGLWYYVAPLVVVRIVIISLILHRLSKRTGAKIPYCTYILFDIFGIIYTITLFLSRKFNPSRDLWI